MNEYKQRLKKRRAGLLVLFERKHVIIRLNLTTFAPHFKTANFLSSFTDLGLSDQILKVLTEMGYETPTDIQEQSIPKLLKADNDFIGLAQTGTGKTAAFGIPLIELVDPSHKATQALVVAPTRELGQQIAEQLQKYGKYMEKVNILCVYGGSSIETQIKALKRDTQHIIVATPGRLIDLVKRKAIKLEEVNVVVLDEADEMLNMGFKEDIDQILSYTPEHKLTWLFSATMPSEIRRIVKTYMEDPVEVKINQQDTVNVNIDHQYVRVKSKDKLEALARFLDAYPDMRGVVFCRTRRDTMNVAEELLKRKYRSDCLHGELSQQQRDRVMKRFKNFDIQVLVATDVAARGIDVDDLTHVIHYSLPEEMSYYTHRSGRTARAGKKGISIAFASGGDVRVINRFGKDLGIEFTQVEVPGAESIKDIRIEQWSKTLLDTKIQKNVDEEILSKVEEVFADLSKEDLLLRLLSSELAKLSTDSNKDLNDTSKVDESRGGGNKGRGYNRGGGNKNYSRSRNDKGGNDRRSGGNDRRGGDDRRSGGDRKKKRRY